MRLEESYYDAIRMMGDASRFKDTETGAHIQRIAYYSLALAQGLGWDVDRCRQIELAAPLHDLGKLGIPDSILHKPGKLDPTEWSVMQTHCMIGHEILVSSKAPILQMAADIARNHHERWDGGGYPDGLQGNDIPEAARIVAIADVFDALCTERPYKAAWSVSEALRWMQSQSGTHFDAELLQLFVDSQPALIVDL